MKATKPVKIPVLMYHAVTPAGTAADNAVHVNETQFSRQMALLQERGYHALSLQDFSSIIADRITPPAKPVLITFDDGYLSQLSRATPVLQQFGFSATLFLTVNAVGRNSYQGIFPGDKDCPPDDRPLTWSELLTMQNKGWEIEAHGCRHSRLASMTDAEMNEEIMRSKSVIEKHLQKEVRYYAYPYGSYTHATLLEIDRQGYTAAFAVHPGLADTGQDHRRYHRIEINKHDTEERFVRKLETGYLSAKQQVISLLRNRLFASPERKDRIMRLAGNLIN